MSPVKTLTALALAASLVAASPMVSRPILVRQDAGQCRNQSCAIATIAGSTGETYYPYDFYPTGDTQAGDCCVVRYFPAAKDAVYEYRPGLESYCKSNGGDSPKDSNPPGVSTVSVNPNLPKPTGSSSKRSEESDMASAGSFAEKRQTDVACKPNILIFVKGTLEPGDLGITIGPSMKDGLDSDLWAVVGVDYDNSFDNDYCLGLPGGINTRQTLHSYAQKCPNSLIAVGGYSQGAMVVRNALARADASDVARVKNFVTFGDPFLGAKIGQYTGPVHVFCAQGDGVCNGQIDIGLGHLSYGGDVSEAVEILEATQQTA